MLKEALYYHKSGFKITCDLCPHNCQIKEGYSGICGVRKNDNGILKTETYGNLSAVNFDPVEKKPLYHFFPGKEILSIGSIGCNMTCKFCQNWQISQKNNLYDKHLNSFTSEEILKLAKSRLNNIGVAYTYNEPTIFFEFMLETARVIKNAGMKNVMVSNGFINEAPLTELTNYIDAFNIDLKAFNNNFYKKQTGSSLEPVLKSLQVISKRNKHLEITCLIIPTLNDNRKEFTEMINWIADNLGKKTVLHLSRYHPDYMLDIRATEASTIEELYSVAAKKLAFVYVGNIHIKDYHNSHCPVCGNIVVSRTGYSINTTGLEKNGKCKGCGTEIMPN